MRCAQMYVCEVCHKRQRPGAHRVVSLPTASKFNQAVGVGVFHVAWDSVRRKLFSTMDQNLRYEVVALIKEETVENDLRLIEKKWIQRAGPMQVLRLDASGAHTYTHWAESCGFPLRVLARDGHHQLRSLDRSDMSSCRSRLRPTRRTVSGRHEPPHANSGTVSCAESVRPGDPRRRGEWLTTGPTNDYLRTSTRGRSSRRTCSVARTPARLFCRPTSAVRCARPLPHASGRSRRSTPWASGCTTGNRHDGSSLRKCHWRGPAFVSHQESSTDLEKSAAGVLWLVHGADLLRTLPELVRPGYPAGRSDREDTKLGKPSTTTAADELLIKLRAARGAIHFGDLTGGPGPEQPERV